MKLVKILPDRIQIKTNDAEFEKARINDLISVSDSEAELITIITAITDTDTESQMDDNVVLEELKEPSLKMVECSILGSVVNGSFKQQVDNYPVTDSHIKKIGDDEFSEIICPTVSKCFRLGDYAGYNVGAWVDGNKFFQRHSCIVGNTGSGKSETIAKIVEETSRATDCNMVIFDIHGEYSRLCHDTLRIGDDTPFPIWMLGFKDIVTNILKVKEDSTVALSALRTSYREQCPDGNELYPAYFDFQEMAEKIEQLDKEVIETGEVYKTGDKKGMPKLSKGDYNGKLSGIANAMNALLGNAAYSFLFEECEQFYDKELYERLVSTNGVKNIDLSGIPHDVAILIIGAIAKMIYYGQAGLQKAGRQYIEPITLICDEAHVYIPSGFQLSASERRMVEIFEEIAKEGRKFGISLIVASQRPSELNKTIMAQCSNYIVMKLNNENDKSMMKGIMAEGSSSVIESTSMFSPGDALVIGDAFPIPLKIHVELAKTRPESRSIDFWDIWRKQA